MIAMVHFKDIFYKFIEKLLKVLLCKSKYAKNISAKELRKGDSLYLKIPNNAPQKVLDDFSVLFEKHQSIRFAYLAEGFLEAKDPPHYIVGIRIETKTGITIAQLMTAMAKELNEFIPQGFYVDFIDLGDRESSINNFMENYLLPFYSKP